MKKIAIILSVMLISLTISAQSFQLKFTTLEKYIIQNYTPEKVKTAISSSYALVKQGDTEWKFRDDSKSWEANLYVQFEKTTKKIKEIQFVAPETRVYEYLDELEKDLGFKLIGTEGQMDILENSSKRLGAKLVPASFLGQGMYLYRIYRL